MGATGSDIEKEAADIIVLNDDFSSVVEGFREGRKAICNIQKIVIYILASNMAQITPFIAFALFQIPLPLSIIFTLCLSIGTDLYPALALAF